MSSWSSSWHRACTSSKSGGGVSVCSYVQTLSKSGVGASVLVLVRACAVSKSGGGASGAGGQSRACRRVIECGAVHHVCVGLGKKEDLWTATQLWTTTYFWTTTQPLTHAPTGYPRQDTAANAEDLSGLTLMGDDYTAPV